MFDAIETLFFSSRNQSTSVTNAALASP